jgi:hypothetical protein
MSRRVPAKPNSSRRGPPLRLQSGQSALHCGPAKPAGALTRYPKQNALETQWRPGASAQAGNSAGVPQPRAKRDALRQGQCRCQGNAKNNGPSGQHHNSTLLSKAETKGRNSAFRLSKLRKRWGVVQAGRAVRCCLTLHSRGRPNGMAHWPSSAGACAPFCACCPACHAAGLPLNLNVRRHETKIFCPSLIPNAESTSPTYELRSLRSSIKPRRTACQQSETV